MNFFRPRSENRKDKTAGFQHPSEYSQVLRAIGQALESLKVKTFNLECVGDQYSVWTKAEALKPEKSRGSILKKISEQKLFNHTFGRRSRDSRRSLHSTRPAGSPRYRYTRADIDRIESEGKKKRRQANGVPDGHSLSQILRTIGALVHQKGHRLLGISWEDFSVSIVTESADGSRTVDVFRPDNLYDQWVKMYLRRSNRALSDIPL